MNFNDAKLILETAGWLVEDTGDIPAVLYHATPSCYINSIKKFGLGGKRPNKRFWDYEGTEYESKFGVFLANDENVAYDFLDSSDDYWELAEEYEAKYDKELEIVVFAINTSDLDLSKLAIDSNNDSEDPTYFYDGVIPYTAIKKIN